MKNVLLASVAVNKAADYYSKAEEVLAPTAPPASASIEAVDPTRARPAPVAAPARAPAQRPKTTLERLRQHEAALDLALDQSYERFRRGEITAKDLDRERNGLIGAFNQLVKSENIRYRSLLRRLPDHLR